MNHEPTDEMHVAAEAIQLGDGDVASLFPRCSQCGPELRSAVEGIRALARFDFYKLAGDLETFSLGKVAEGLPLGLDTQSRAALFRIFREEQGVALHASAIIVAHNRGATDVKRRVP